MLLVDNEPDLLKSLKRFLKARGHDVQIATSAFEGLEILSKRCVDLVISDIQMPEMDGVALLRAVRKKFPEMAVVLMTGHATVDTAVDALRLGAMDYLRKPIQLDELQGCVRRVRAQYDICDVKEAAK